MSVLGDSKLGSFGNYVIMSDFWMCKITHKKYMGVRVYFVDSNWEDLEQILSLLEPISRLKRHCQAERPNQVEVLMELYQIRLDTLNLAEPL
eukprot:jgi/Phyca11/133412/e_gw1.455.9.1